MSKVSAKNLLEWFRENNRDAHGSTVSGIDVRAVLNLRMPELGTKSEFDSIALKELSAIDYVRNVLLDEGKYLKQDGDGYRILLPSENAVQINNFMLSANRKLRRAHRLSKSSQVEPSKTSMNTEARMAVQRQAIMEHRAYGRPTYVEERV